MRYLRSDSKNPCSSKATESVIDLSTNRSPMQPSIPSVIKDDMNISAYKPLYNHSINSTKNICSLNNAFRDITLDTTNSMAQT